jgi:hypothetical protein
MRTTEPSSFARTRFGDEFVEHFCLEHGDSFEPGT